MAYFHEADVYTIYATSSVNLSCMTGSSYWPFNTDTDYKVAAFRLQRTNNMMKRSLALTLKFYDLYAGT